MVKLHLQQQEQRVNLNYIEKMAAAHGASSLSQSAVDTDHEAIDWASIDDEFCSIISTLNETLNQNLVDTSEASAMFTRLLHSHLGQLGILGDRGRSSGEGFAGRHREKGIIKLTRRLAKLKNIARRSFHAQPVAFLNGARVHNKSLKVARKTTQLRSARQQEKAFRSNPWLFAKSVCSPSGPPIVPSFSASICQSYFEKLFSGKGCSYFGLPGWVHNVSPPTDIVSEFDLSPITPEYSKRTLQKCSSKSSPGDNKLTYHHLKNLPTTHHFLATLFTKLLLSSHDSHPDWCIAKSILIHKKDDPAHQSTSTQLLLPAALGNYSTKF